jgi:hypothetical protein
MFERGCETDRDSEDTPYLNRCLENPVERVSTRVAEHEHLSTVVV